MWTGEARKPAQHQLKACVECETNPRWETVASSAFRVCQRTGRRSGGCVAGTRSTRPVLIGGSVAGEPAHCVGFAAMRRSALGEKKN
ncbi:hypothetical protein QJS10_CPB11g02018 [Acorus calamus]|uniref:Uncharacterized protein n=1 Tax=Acorus calamus TaxID=4465 RepID=A0AAV9DQT0_ACOCL|nr:hypothetical protein QJS10_CPB11g02018 [Acorus calamus]